MCCSSRTLGLGTDTTFTLDYLHYEYKLPTDAGVPVITVPGSTVGRPITEYGLPRDTWYGSRNDRDEVKVDSEYIRCAFALLTPVQVFFTLFFAQVIVGCIAQVIGPIKQMRENSRFYSAMLPVRITSRPLPHVTIQCPVYKEGLHSVIAPTVRSIKKAISTYELQGGSANIFVNDDGMQLISDEERQEVLA